MERDFIADRAKAVDASGIRRVFDLAAKLKDPINLSIGLPDFDVPGPAKSAAIDAIRRGDNRYTPTQGIAPLRDRLRADLTRELGRDCGEVLVTSGVSGGLYLAFLTCVNPGDEVVFLDPYFVMYRHLVTMAGGRPVAVDSYPSFRFDADRIEAAITPRTKMLVVNSPGNPTGVTMTQSEVRAAVDLARRHDLLLVSDEIYVPFVYGDVPPSPATLDDRVLLLRGFSKSHGMTGWRLGYAVGPAAVVEQMTKLQQYTYVCAPAPFQHAALSALDLDVREHVDAYRRKRDLVVETLGEPFGVSESQPSGAFYAFCRVPAGLGMTGTQFCEKAVEKGVLVIPGSVFSGRDTHFRLSYATDDARLRRGCEVLRELA